MSSSDSENSNSGVFDVEVTQMTEKCAEKGPRNIFKNDGSFLKIFQQLQREEQSDSHPKASELPIPSAETSPTTPKLLSKPPVSEDCESEKELAKKKPLVGLVGKRRGGRVLPTGVVKKQRKNKPIKVNESSTSQWSQYMDEVRKYKEFACEEEGKRIPLVK
ncbi:telomerase RNA component interacting RNase-like [Ischnura elegans]|uniref:telomerase RNA component interacting RNase-like n=1 Tax=Ischnura elegans TaxID=197161 RepID=UPI001ED884A1|nr:telomerase RNA component interacting RNase-like [Ischnura elegans]